MNRSACSRTLHVRRRLNDAPLPSRDRQYASITPGWRPSTTSGPLVPPLRISLHSSNSMPTVDADAARGTEKQRANGENGYSRLRILRNHPGAPISAQPSPAQPGSVLTIDGGILERSSRQFGVGDAELFGLLSEQLAGGVGATV